jgi:hypothetical protein
MGIMLPVATNACAWLSADALMRLLDASVLPYSARIRSLMTEEVHGGQTAEVVRIVPIYDHPVAGAPERLIAKFPRAYYRDDAIRDRMCNNERNFYLNVPSSCRSLVPRLLNRVRDRVDATPPVLLLEDLGPRTGSGDLQGCTPVEMRAAVAALARVHRTTSMVRKDFPVLTEGVDALLTFYRESWCIVGKDSSLEIPGVVQSLGSALCNSLPEVRRQLTTYPACLVHGDFHAENLFFGRADTPGGVRVIDWQFASQGPGLLDVVYLLCWACRPETRRALAAELVADYLAQTGAPRLAARGYETLMAWCTAFILARSVNLLAAALRRPPSEQAFARTMFERTATAWQDIDPAHRDGVMDTA